MQIQFHHAELRTHAQATEVRERVLAALKFVAGDTAEIEGEELDGHHGNPILRLSARIGQTARVRVLFERLAEDEAALATLAAQLDTRMDEEGALFFRLSKQEAYMGRLTLAADDDAIQVRVKVATYPVRADVARTKMREYLAKLATRKDK